MIKKSPLSKRLKQARQAAGISQKQLGIKVGIDEFTASARMNQYETGKHVPDFSTVSRIAKILHLPSAYFYTEEELLAQVLLNYSRLNKSQKQDLLDYIQKL